MTLDTVRAEFEKGNYSEALRSTGRSLRPSQERDWADFWVFQVGALVFAGEMLEARTVFDLGLARGGAGKAREAQARFYLGTGLVRRSRYDEAVSAFALNLALLRAAAKQGRVDPLLVYFASQGAAFLKFFRADFPGSRKLAERAYQAAFEAQYVHGQVLALDLMGHCSCQIGEIRKGLADLQKALALSPGLGNSGLKTAFQVALTRYRCLYGVELRGAEKELKGAIRNLPHEDTYSRGELCLELARHLVLRGKASQAQKLLDQNSELIYRHQSRQQSAIYHLRYAHILHLKGESHAALAMLRSAVANLPEGMDPMFRRRLEGLESAIRTELFGAPPVERRPFVNLMDLRIQSRAGVARATEARDRGLARKGEDVIGDWLDLCASPGTQAALELPALIETGLHGLIPRLLARSHSISPRDRTILLGPVRGALIAFAQGDVHVVPIGVTAPMRRILFALEGGRPVSKKKLVEEIWQYQYRADRHDRLLHATTAKLRKLLGPFGSWLEWTSEGYRLTADARVAEVHGSPEAVRRIPLRGELSAPAPEPLRAHSGLEQLNHRQLQALRILKPGTLIGVGEYARRFGVCKMTACRDLTSLYKSNRVARVGKARATRYGIHPFGGVSDSYENQESFSSPR